MQKNKNGIPEHDDGTYVVKRSKKSSILAFIICILLAIVIWSYAEAADKQNKQDIAEAIGTAEIFTTDTAENEG